MTMKSSKDRSLKADCCRLFDIGFTPANIPLTGRRSTIQRYYRAWKLARAKQTTRKESLISRMFSSKPQPEPPANVEVFHPSEIRSIRDLRKLER